MVVDELVTLLGLRKSANFNSTAKSVESSLNSIAKVGVGISAAVLGSIGATGLFVNKTEKALPRLIGLQKAMEPQRKKYNNLA